MFDTIKIFSADPKAIDINYIENKYGLERCIRGPYSSYTTKIKNITFISDDYGIHLQGSAPRFIHDHNVETLKYHEIRHFIASLSDAVDADISMLKLTRLDITDNMSMTAPVKAYKRYFGSCKHFERIDYQYNGVEYRNGVRNLIFYDKLLQLKEDKKNIPESYRGKNLLRYEYRITGNRKAHLHSSNVFTLSDLTVPANYVAMVNKWECQFNKIDIINFQPTVAMPYIEGMKLREYVMLVGAHNNGGIDAIFNDVNDWVEMGYFTDRIACTFIKNINKYQRKYNQLSKNEIFDKRSELIEKIKQKAVENRQI